MVIRIKKNLDKQLELFLAWFYGIWYAMQL